MVYAKENMEDFTLTADVKDWFMLIAVVSLLVHLSLTITDKIIVGFLLKAMKAIWRKCKKRTNDDEIEIQVITSMSGGEVCHLHNCEHAKKIRTGNKKVWRICTECKRYLQKETDRVFEARSEV